MSGIPTEPGYRLKLRRAAQHLEAIDYEARAFADNLGPAVPWEAEPANEWTVFKRGEVARPDPMWGTLLGDFIHNTRSALDNLVCAMIERNDPDRSLKDAAFPAYEGRRQWDAEIVSRDRSNDGAAPTDGVSPEVLAAIEQSQPYHIQSKAAKRRAPLLLLQTASNFDKHRTLHAVRVEIAPRSVFKGELRITPQGYFHLLKKRIALERTPVETGAEIGRAKVRVLQLPPSNVEVGVHALSAIDIRFAIEGEAFDIVHRDLWAMISAAWRAVLRAEYAAGIDIAAMPDPVPGWTWNPGNPTEPLFA